jgi:predicted dehydrogenase
VLRLDNFRVLHGYGWTNFRKMKLGRLDKGHRAEFQRFTRAVAEGAPGVVPFRELENVMRAAFAAVVSARTGGPVAVDV